MADFVLAKGALAGARLAVLTIAFGLADAALTSADAGRTTIDSGGKPFLVIGGIVATAAFLAWGGIFLTVGLRKFRLGEAAQQWPSTQGEVIASDIAEGQGYNDGDYTYYSPDVRYAYSVNGVSYFGRTVRAGMADVHYLAKAPVEATLARYPVGARPQVRYDPADPAVSTLEIGQVGGGKQVISGAIGLALAAGAVLFTVWTILTPSG